MLRKISLLSVLLSLAVQVGLAQNSVSPTKLTLEQCRELALKNNKQMAIQKEKVRQAEYQKKEAFAAYLPAIDFAGGYTRNQKKISIFDSDQMLPTESFNPATGKYELNLVKNPETGMPVMVDGKPVPSEVALIPKSAMEYDVRNLFFGAVTLTQPVYMGGKIVALNKLADIAKQAAEALRENESQNTIYNVDAAYWTVVSLMAKHSLAVSFVNLLDSLDHNVGLMVKEGVATPSDKLSVDVKLNQAQIDLVKVENGLSLSKMALSQLCGLAISDNYDVADDLSEVDTKAEIATKYNMNDVYARRADLRALTMAAKAADQEKNIARASMLPNVALVGAYGFSNPNMFDGFKKKFSGQFSVGVAVTVPIWHWGGNYNKYRVAKTAETISNLQVEQAREMIDLQVSQAAFKAQEALKTYEMTLVNLKSANENLRSAQLGFREGVLTVDNVMAAQTAWLQANSEKIDASIEVHLCDVYLSKVLGTL